MAGLEQDNNDRPAVLLLSRDAAWTRSVQREMAGQAAARLLVVSVAREAVALLCRGERFSHLLIHPSAADGLLPDLIRLTVGEAESGVAMVVLGEPGTLPQPVQDIGRVTRVRQRRAGWLGRVLTGEARSAAEIEELPLADLLAALREGRLQTRYQPVVRLQDGRPLGYEALARLEHPALGTLPPERFVPQIEAAGHAAQLAEAVVQRAFSEWSGDALRQLHVKLGVNLPLDVLMQPGATSRLDAWCGQAGIPPRRIVVELTETYPVARPDLLAPVMDGMRAAGYALAIDDVQPATYDLDTLMSLPFSSLKLDREVVRASAESEAAQRFIEQAAAAGRRAGMLVLAEGIETAEDWVRMQRLGVEAGQGFHIGRPLTAVASGIWHADWPWRKAA